MMMWKNQHPPGNMAVLVNAPRPGLRNFEDVHGGGGAELVGARLRARLLLARFAQIAEFNSPP